MRKYLNFTKIKAFIKKVIKSNKLPYTLAKGNSAFNVKFLKEHKKTRTIMIPTLSPSFTKIAEAALLKEGITAISLPVANQRAIQLGKKYVHNDICYPAQLNVGEALEYLERDDVNPDNMAFVLGNNCKGCRAGHYVALSRKAFDDAGYEQMPILTTTPHDGKNVHPGFKMGLSMQICFAWGIALSDAIDAMARRIRPYVEDVNDLIQTHHVLIDRLKEALKKSYKHGRKVLKEAIEIFNNFKLKDIPRLPRVLVVGEILVNYHPSANIEIERYLEKNGMECDLPAIFDFFHADSSVIEKERIKKNMVKNPIVTKLLNSITDSVYCKIANTVDKIMKEFKFYEGKIFRSEEISRDISEYIDLTYGQGEGWLLAGDIVHGAKHGINSFIILNPFGCLPNHITGRGMIKPIKEKFPHIQVLALDYDPDTSIGNIENRLQMLIINAKKLEKIS